jgi:SAM-dependent methyltransferase/uncharacterized protein YndB with AHSA1/START domain
MQVEDIAMSQGAIQEQESTLRASLEVGLPPPAAFAVFVEELAAGLARRGITFDPDEGGRVVANEYDTGRVVAWEPGRRLLIEWHPASWEAEQVTEVEVTFAPFAGGTRLVLVLRGWAQLVGGAGELLGWFAGEAVAPLLGNMSPSAFGDWLTDRRARRPSGAQARAVYRDPLYHYPNFRAILAELHLTPADYLVEVGCGGGAFLKEALRSGCRAAAVDHSPDMVRLAQEENRPSLASGKLEVRQASADRLPFSDATFTCAVMTGVLGFLPDPVAALGEIRRVLGPGGRLVALGSDPELRGTPAAPEPMASRLRFYDEKALRQLAVAAGFAHVQVVRRDLEPYAREAGIPQEHLGLFAGEGARFLLARKD